MPPLRVFANLEIPEPYCAVTGLGLRDHEMRAQHLDAINRFRGV